VIVVIGLRLPISCVSSVAISCRVPAVSMANLCAGQFGVFVYLVLRCLVGCCTWFSCYYYLSTCLTRRYYRSVRSCAVCVRSVPSRCPVETLRAEISSLNDQLRSAAKRLASVDAIFRNKFTLFLQARAKSQLIRFTSHRQGLF